MGPRSDRGSLLPRALSSRSRRRGRRRQSHEGPKTLAFSPDPIPTFLAQTPRRSAPDPGPAPDLIERHEVSQAISISPTPCKERGSPSRGRRRMHRPLQSVLVSSTKSLSDYPVLSCESRLPQAAPNRSVSARRVSMCQSLRLAEADRAPSTLTASRPLAALGLPLDRRTEYSRQRHHQPTISEAFSPRLALAASAGFPVRQQPSSHLTRARAYRPFLP